VSLTGPSPDIIEPWRSRRRARRQSARRARTAVALSALGADARVRYVQAARRIRPNNDLAMQDIRASQVRTVTNGIFTGGDRQRGDRGPVRHGDRWTHQDFRHATARPVLYIWTDERTAPACGRTELRRGNECSAAVINAGLQRARRRSARRTCRDRRRRRLGGARSVCRGGAGSGHHRREGRRLQLLDADIIAGISTSSPRRPARPPGGEPEPRTLFGPHDAPKQRTSDRRPLRARSHRRDRRGNDAVIPPRRPQHAIFLVHATRTLAAVGDTAQIGDTVPRTRPSRGPERLHAVHAGTTDAIPSPSRCGPDAPRSSGAPGIPSTRATPRRAASSLTTPPRTGAADGDRRAKSDVRRIPHNCPPRGAG